MSQKIVVESLAMDLKRMAMGLHRGSFNMAKRFKEEALKRTQELDDQDSAPYLKRLITETRKRLAGTGDRVAEDALMLSTLFQNFALKNF